MDHFDPSDSIPSTSMQPPPTHQSAYPLVTSPVQAPPTETTWNLDKGQPDVAFAKGPKRKRLAKACDACHKSKRRCDGTSPCSNCYFASKTCTYTDSAGRPVPAPRPFKPDRPDPPQLDLAFDNQSPDHFIQPAPQAPQITNSFTFTQFPLQAPLNPSADQESVRKRFRLEHGKQLLPVELIPTDLGSASNTTLDRPAGLDHSLTRELVNLFFTHCNPTRMIIHKPSFSAALSHNQVPSYLLHAVCAVAAPWSKQTRIRTIPARCAGKPFAQEALSKMFDGTGRLACEHNLATAQALCLLQIQDLVSKPSYSTWYRDLALQIVESLELHKPDNPTLTPLPSTEFVETSIERECVRRIFWLTHLMDLLSSIYFGTILPPKENELRLRLPVDETSFELAVHSSLSEYLYLPAPRAQYASEFGHLIRVISMYSQVENILDAFNDPNPANHPFNSLLDLEHALDSWVSSLPDHLRFSEETLQLQLSMHETSSNTGAWCFFCMHVLHASVTLAMNGARQRCQRGLKTEPQWALSCLDSIVSSLGSRALTSLIMGAALWSLVKYCKRDDPQIQKWSTEYQEIWGFSIQELVSRDWRQYSQLRQPQPRSLETRNPVTSPLAIPRRQQRDSDDPTFRSSSVSPSAYPSLGKSLGDLRLHNRPPHLDPISPGEAKDPHEMESKRLIGDANIDPALQSGMCHRNHGIIDGPQSLPSLKASGLLDSWIPKDGSVVGAWSTGSHSRSEIQNQPIQHRSLPRRPIPAQIPIASSDLDVSRTGASSMPVGMPWLANER